MPDQIYNTLPTLTSIRLLKLEGTNLAGEIQCRLIVTDLLRPPKYTAISYACGSSSDKVQAICNGQTIDIPRNLNNVLLKHRTHQDYFWADALSIEQNDVNEKSRQVRMMGDVYKRAASVLVWFGDEGRKNDAKLLFEDIRVLARGLWEVYNSGGIINWFDEASSELHWSPQAGEKRVTSLAHCGMVMPDNDCRERLITFLRSAWFSRVWVVQETGLSSKAEVLWQDVRIDWDLIGIAFMFLRRFCRRMLDRQSFTKQVHNVCQYFTLFSILRPHLTFTMVLDDTRALLAKDSRDKIFSLLSHPLSRAVSWAHCEEPQFGSEREASIDLVRRLLVSNEKQIRIDSVREQRLSMPAQEASTPIVEADYSKTKKQVYTEFARNTIARSRSLDVLAYAGQSSELLERPTWVPRWHKLAAMETLVRSNGRYRASGELEADFQFPTVTSTGFAGAPPNHPDNAILCAKGIQVSHLIGTIRHMSSTLCHDDRAIPSGPRADVDEYRRGQEDAMKGAVSDFWTVIGALETSHYPDLGADRTAGMTLLQAYAATLVGNRTSEDVPHLNVQKDFAAYWKRVWNLKNNDNDDDEHDEEGNTIADWERYYVAASNLCEKRRVFITEAGYLGLGPEFMKQGDVILVLLGMEVPVVVRREDERKSTNLGRSDDSDDDDDDNDADSSDSSLNPRRWELVGECYIHGLMQGQATRVGLEPEEFVFI